MSKQSSRQNKTIADIEKQYGVDFGLQDNTIELQTYLRRQGLPSLAKCLDILKFKKNVGRYKLVRKAKKEIASYKVEPKSKGGRYLAKLTAQGV